MPDLVVTSDLNVDPETGLISPARFCQSPNRDARPDDVILDTIILHGISLPPGKFGGPEIEALFMNQLDWDAHPYFQKIRGAEVSAHMLIRRDGEVLQFVRFTERAWHAGASCFRGRSRCNDYSIGIELEGDDETAYDERQYRVLAQVLQALFAAYPATSSKAVVGHSDVAPGRKTDPGPAFDWQHLYDVLRDQPETQNP